jgi:hypothetical protein
VGGIAENLGAKGLAGEELFLVLNITGHHGAWLSLEVLHGEPGINAGDFFVEPDEENTDFTVVLHRGIKRTDGKGSPVLPHYLEALSFESTAIDGETEDDAEEVPIVLKDLGDGDGGIGLLGIDGVAALDDPDFIAHVGLPDAVGAVFFVPVFESAWKETDGGVILASGDVFEGVEEEGDSKVVHSNGINIGGMVESVMGEVPGPKGEFGIGVVKAMVVNLEKLFGFKIAITEEGILIAGVGGGLDGHDTGAGSRLKDEGTKSVKTTLCFEGTHSAPEGKHEMPLNLLRR